MSKKFFASLRLCAESFTRFEKQAFVGFIILCIMPLGDLAYPVPFKSVQSTRALKSRRRMKRMDYSTALQAVF
jgi:hypothetical protein